MTRLHILLVTALYVAAISLTAPDICRAAGDKAVIEFEWDLPFGFPVPVVPEDDPDTPEDESNPMSYEKIELGRFLFHDTRLSGNQTFSCASCHEQSLAFTDGLPRSIGSTGEMTPRGSMTLANIAYAPSLTWANNVLTHLEEQALVPMFGEFPVELGLAGREEQLFERLRAVELYQRMFAEAFPDKSEPVDLEAIVKAIGSYQRNLISGNSRYDQWLFGDDDALSESELKGFELIRDVTAKTECGHCHNGFNFTSAVTENHEPSQVERPFFNTGLYNLRCTDFGLPPVAGNGFGCYPPENTGLFEVSTFREHMGHFKAPTLRNICVTPPYMHDGSIDTLDGVLDHYSAGGRTIESGPHAGIGSINPLKSSFLVGFQLTQEERDDIKNFLCSLTDEEFLNDPSIGDPFVGPPCTGDCNYDGSVAINELVRQVTINLDTGTLASCVAGDANLSGNIEVNEIIRSVNYSLDSCPG